PAECRADVYLNGAFFTQLSHNTPTAQTDMKWVAFSFPFRASTTETMLTLTDVTDLNPYQGLVLDSLSVTLVDIQNPPIVSAAAPAAPAGLTVTAVTTDRI